MIHSKVFGISYVLFKCFIFKGTQWWHNKNDLPLEWLGWKYEESQWLVSALCETLNSWPIITMNHDKISKYHHKKSLSKSDLMV